MRIETNRGGEGVEFSVDDECWVSVFCENCPVVSWMAGKRSLCVDATRGEEKRKGKGNKNKKAMAAHMGSHSTQMDNRWTLHRTATRYLHDARWLPLAYLLTGARGGTGYTSVVVMCAGGLARDTRWGYFRCVRPGLG